MGGRRHDRRHGLHRRQRVQWPGHLRSTFRGRSVRQFTRRLQLHLPAGLHRQRPSERHALHRHQRVRGGDEQLRCHRVRRRLHQLRRQFQLQLPNGMVRRRPHKRYGMRRGQRVLGGESLRSARCGRRGTNTPAGSYSCSCQPGWVGDGRTTGTGCTSLLIPELLYYRFDGSGIVVPNQALTPPMGTASAAIIGGQTQGGAGKCGGALVGNGGSGNTNYVSTGWATALTGTSWTISFWTSNIPDDHASLHLVRHNRRGLPLLHRRCGGSGQLDHARSLSQRRSGARRGELRGGV